YRMALVATEIESGVARWAEDQALRKKVDLRGISPAASETMHMVGYASAGLVTLVGGAAVLFSLANMRIEDAHTEIVQDDPHDPFSDSHFEKVIDSPARGPEPLSGVAGCLLLVTGPVIGILTYALVPAGNPAIDSE